MLNPLKIVIIYSREDKKYLEELDSHLATLKRNAKIAIWSDRAIAPGANWDMEIESNISNADLIIMLISASFFNSQYVQNREMREATTRWEQKKVDLIPIIVRPCDFEGDPLIKKLQWLPTNGEPINGGRWKTLDEAYLDVVKGLRNKIDTLNQKRQTEHAQAEAKHQQVEAVRLKAEQDKLIKFIQAEVDRLKAEQDKLSKFIQTEVDRALYSALEQHVDNPVAKVGKALNERLAELDAYYGNAFDEILDVVQGQESTITKLSHRVSQLEQIINDTDIVSRDYLNKQLELKKNKVGFDKLTEILGWVAATVIIICFIAGMAFFGESIIQINLIWLVPIVFFFFIGAIFLIAWLGNKVDE